MFTPLSPPRGERDGVRGVSLPTGNYFWQSVQTPGQATVQDMQTKSYWFGGIIMCVFPALILFLAHNEESPLPLAVTILLWLFLLCGVWAATLSAFKLDTDSGLSWVFGALTAAGFAVFAFLVAWREKDGWGGGIPFVPAAWNQAAARILFALGGLLALTSAVVFLRKALRKFREDRDGEGGGNP
jgi:hypothetical protein